MWIPIPSCLSVCFFTSHPRGATSQRDSSRPGAPASQVWAWFCHHSGSPSSALCYLYRWNMPWKFWVRQMKGGSDQTAPWFHLGSHICIFSNREEIPFSNRGFYNVLFEELKLKSFLLLKHCKRFFYRNKSIKIVSPLAYEPVSLGMQLIRVF